MGVAIRIAAVAVIGLGAAAAFGQGGQTITLHELPCGTSYPPGGFNNTADLIRWLRQNQNNPAGYVSRCCAYEVSPAGPFYRTVLAPDGNRYDVWVLNHDTHVECNGPLHIPRPGGVRGGSSVLEINMQGTATPLTNAQARACLQRLAREQGLPASGTTLPAGYVPDLSNLDRPLNPSWNWRRCDANQMMGGLGQAGTCGTLSLMSGQLAWDGVGRCYNNPADGLGPTEVIVGSGGATFFAGGTLMGGGMFLEGCGLAGGAGLTGAGATVCAYAPPVALCAGTFAVSYCGTRCADNACGGRLSGGCAVGMCAVYDTALNACWRWTPWGDGCNYNLTRNCQFSDPPRYSPRPLSTPCQGGNPTRVDPPYDAPAHEGGGGGCSMATPSGRVDGGLALWLGLLLSAWWWRRRRVT